MRPRLLLLLAGTGSRGGRGRSGQRMERERWSQTINLKALSPSGLLPPANPCFLREPQSPRAVPPAGDQGSRPTTPWEHAATSSDKGFHCPMSVFPTHLPSPELPQPFGLQCSYHSAPEEAECFIYKTRAAEGHCSATLPLRMEAWPFGQPSNGFFGDAGHGPDLFQLPESLCQL